MQLLNLLHLNIHINFKPIKNIYLRVLPPDGKINICAPHHTPIELIKKFVYQKLDWIEGKQKIMLQMSTNNHLKIFGENVEVIVNHCSINTTIQLQDNKIVMYIPKYFTQQAKESLLIEFYKKLLFKKCQGLIEQWEMRLQVKVNKLSIRHMKTRWGSCTPQTGNIRINLKLIHFEEQYLEYIIVHELTHLIEASHNQRFKALMSKNLPNWISLRQALNQLPN